MCCGETTLLFLSIDHINEDGAEHRRALISQGHGPAFIYYWLRDNDFPAGFQVLCMNCQFGKSHSPERICPHQLRFNQLNGTVLANGK